MIEDKDYVMRLVHEIIRTLIRLLFQKDIEKDAEPEVSLELLAFYKKLTAMIEDGKINEAENLLVDGLDADSPAYFEVALLFYEKLGSKPEEFLEARQYTQDEVLDGLKYVVDYYGYGELWDTFR